MFNPAVSLVRCDTHSKQRFDSPQRPVTSSLTWTALHERLCALVQGRMIAESNIQYPYKSISFASCKLPHCLSLSLSLADPQSGTAVIGDVFHNPYTGRDCYLSIFRPLLRILRCYRKGTSASPGKVFTRLIFFTTPTSNSLQIGLLSSALTAIYK